MNNTKAENNFGVFLSGLLLGATLTALFTPRKGDDMRDTIKRKLSDINESTKDVADKAGQVAEDKAEDLKHAIQKGRDKINNKDSSDDQFVP